MTFPVIFHPFGLPLHAHLLFESLAYTGGFQLFLLLRRREKHEPILFELVAWILVGATFGALFGSKVLAWLEQPAVYLRFPDPARLLSGKTIVGGLLGGWAGVEIAKKVLGVRHRTGDAYAYPLILAIAVGRVGCFLTGLADQTHGVATNLPWGVDFGDGIARHPTQLYEIAWLIVLAGVIAFVPKRDGLRFRAFLGGYLGFRFIVEFIKPSPKGYTHLSAIQWACAVGVALCVWQLIRQFRREGAR
jgi:phosphatidylglycerol---prolipoprotein diacylglyceryl transferase